MPMCSKAFIQLFIQRCAYSRILSCTLHADLFKAFKTDDDAREFIGHAMALYTDDSYLANAAADLVKRIRLYGYRRL